MKCGVVWFFFLVCLAVWCSLFNFLEEFTVLFIQNYFYVSVLKVSLSYFFLQGGIYTLIHTHTYV